MSPDPELGMMLRINALADFARPFAVGAVATLGIADLFRDPQPVHSIAATSGLDAQALQRLLRLLVAHGVFLEPEPGTFALAPMARLLTDTHPWSMRSAYTSMPADVRAWGQMNYSLRTGRGAFEHVHGRTLWQYLSENPEASARFDRSMEDLSRLEALWLLDAYDWTQFRTLVDVGGGNGATLVALLGAFPTLRGVLFDLPHVVARAVTRIEAAGLAERCRLEPGDFFAHMPAGHDVYVLKRIIYSYDDADAARILQRVRAAMRQDSRVLLVEPVRRKGDEFDYGKLLDMQMLMLGGGRVRDRRALRKLLAGEGLRLRRVIPTPIAAVVEALPE